MDKTDRELIGLLRENARESVSSLAQMLGVSRATVRHHMAKLERSGQITGYSVLTRADTAPEGIRAITMVAIEGHKTERITSQVYRIPAAHRVHATSGKWDLIIEFHAADITGLDTALSDLRTIEGIAASETSIIMATRSRGIVR